MMRHHYQPRLKIDRPLLSMGLRCDQQKKKAVFNSFFGNDFFELTLQVCTEEAVYVQRIGFASQNLFRLRRKTRFARLSPPSLVFRPRRALAPSALDTRASRSWLISHGPC